MKKIALAQMNVEYGNVQKNIATAENFICSAIDNKCDLILLPELWSTGFDYQHLDDYAVLNYSLMVHLQSISDESNTTIGGSFVEKQGSQFYNSFNTLQPHLPLICFFGGLFFVSVWLAKKWDKDSGKPDYWFLVIGITAGLLSLTRSDGVLWLAGGLLSVLLINGFKPKSWQNLAINAAMVLIGFCAVMTPWYIHNIRLYQGLYPSGNGLMLWLTKYDDLFVYPFNSLTFSHWIESGFGNILLDRLKALGFNLQTLVASGGAIILTPIMLVGIWKTRKSTLTRLALAILIAILVVMTVIFPYAGERGGFFHSLSAVQIILWSFVPVGLDAIIQHGVKNRNWKTDRSWKMFGTALVAVVGIISTVIFAEKFTHGTESGVPWNETQAAFNSIEQGILSQTNDNGGVIMVNDPPGFSLATGRPSVMIPTGSDNAIIDVSKQYNIRFLAVNGERTEVLMNLKQSNSLAEHFKFIFETAGNCVYEFKP